jgi:hypothetical protein
MHDNLRVHRAILVQDWFAERDIDVMDWPPYSPDMNAIENLWKLLKAKIIELYPVLVTMKNNDTTQGALDSSSKGGMVVTRKRPVEFACRRDAEED